MTFLDELTVDEVPCDYRRIAKKFGNKNIRLRRELRATKNNYWKFIKMLRRKIGYQKAEIRELRRILGNSSNWFYRKAYVDELEEALK